MTQEAHEPDKAEAAGASSTSDEVLKVARRLKPLAPWVPATIAVVSVMFGATGAWFTQRAAVGHIIAAIEKHDVTLREHERRIAEHEAAEQQLGETLQRIEAELTVQGKAIASICGAVLGPDKCR